MTDTAFDALLARLEKAPDNLTLRLAILRRARSAGLASRALELVLELDPDAVADADDRELVACTFEEAGLDDDAAIWRGAEDEATAAEPSAPTTSVPPVRPVAKPQKALRVVGGTDGPDPFGDAVVEEEAPLTFEDVGGLDDVKRDIERRIIAPFRHAGLLSRFKKRAGGGVLLYGPPGCGKTMIARAMAGEAGFNFLSVGISDILDYHVGSSEQHLSAVFDKARNNTPAVLFFDEIDALGSKRTSDTAVHQNQLVSHFLAQMDGVDNRNDGVLLLAATNIPWSMDGAFLRPGRFDRLFFVPPPDRKAREAILALELDVRPAKPDLAIDQVAARTSGLSGADLAQIIERAADLAIDATLEQGREVPIDNDMLAEATRTVRSSVLDWLSTARNHATYSNESGRYDDILDFLKKHGRT